MANLSKIEVSNPLVTMSVRDFMLDNGLTVHNEVRVNTNKYPYLTFINEKNEAENIYFSKSASALVTEGQPVVKGFFDNFLMVETTNADGEKRIKIARAGSTSRLAVEDLF